MRKILFSVLFLSVIQFTLHAAENDLMPNSQRPKIGLCLSGGGAKGLAYVGLLKLIDSLDIKIDYITGTSMGSIVGGLYAIGYSGKELEQIAINTNWSKYLTNNVPLNKISVEEKDEYARYMIELKSNTLSPDLPIGVIDGQNIMAFLNDLTFRVNQISDFSKFPIPFKCVAVDMVTGKPVVIDKGSLALAMRTSMSIPTAFSPIDTGKMLLVDGGLFKNFPVEYVKEMGADFVIGGNTGGTLLKKKELKSMMNLLEQMTSFSIAEDFQKQKQLCDLLIDYTDSLKAANIGTADFGKSKEILAVGEQVAHLFLKPLIELANSQHQYQHQDIDTTRLNKTDSISGKIKFTLDKSTLGQIVRNKIRIKDYDNISKTDINNAVEDIYATRYFDKVYYYVENNGDQHNLIIKTVQTKKFAYKLGIHYDNEMSAGIIANITARNLFFQASRFIATIDISDNPKARIGYQVYTGSRGFYVSTNHFFERAKQNAFYDNLALGIYKTLFLQSDVLMNYAMNQNSVVSAGIAFKWGTLKPFTSALDKSELSRSLFSLTKRPYINSSIVAKYIYNSLDKQVFATKGNNAFMQTEFVFAGKTTAKSHTETIQVDPFLNYHIVATDTAYQYAFSPYFKLYGMYEHVFKLHKKVSLDARVDLGMIFLFRPSHTNLATLQADAFYLGGIEQRERERTASLIPFWGDHELYVQNLNFLSASLSMQYEAIKNLFFIPKVSVFTGDNAEMSVYGGKGVISNLKENKLVFVHSEGMTIAYKTPVGPVKFNISKASNYRKPTYYFSLGYRF